ncbi:putative gp14 [Burkholderia pseudomallei MSHR3951]|nr:putative gp14 [Burkholderia pseudomallei MSHR3951]
MDPVSALTIGSAAISTVGAISGGMAKSAQASQQAAALDRNAALSDQQATQVYAQSVNRETAQRAQAGQQLGEQRAAVAESGFNPNVGSALDTQVQSVRNAELDALQTRYQGILQGQSLEDQAQQDRYAARTARASARNSLVAGGISAAASLLGGVASYAKTGGSLFSSSTGGSFSTLGGLSSYGRLGNMTAGLTSGVNKYGFSGGL